MGPRPGEAPQAAHFFSLAGLAPAAPARPGKAPQAAHLSSGLTGLARAAPPGKAPQAALFSSLTGPRTDFVSIPYRGTDVVFDFLPWADFVFDF